MTRWESPGMKYYQTAKFTRIMNCEILIVRLSAAEIIINKKPTMYRHNYGKISARSIITWYSDNVNISLVKVLLTPCSDHIRVVIYCPASPKVSICLLTCGFAEQYNTDNHCLIKTDIWFSTVCICKDNHDVNYINLVPARVQQLYNICTSVFYVFIEQCKVWP